MHHIDWSKGIVNEGNGFRIRRVMRKTQMTGELTVGFIGGSITQGSLATEANNCYAARVVEWWKRKFPDSHIKYVNAGIGGTTSHFGVARVKSDLLDKEPDFVIVEYSVNDDNDDFFKETYEGLIRRVLNAPSSPAVMLVHNVRYDNGVSSEDIHGEIGRYYNLPCVSMKATIYPQVMCDNIPVRDITEDDLHPNDYGHELVAKAIENALEEIYSTLVNVENGVDATLPLPLTENRYENAMRYRNDYKNVVCQGFVMDKRIQNGITDTFKKGFRASEIGDRIYFKITGTELAIQYRKTVRCPAPIAIAVIDGDEDNGVILDANFDEDWGDCTYLQPVLIHGENKEHSIEIRIVEAHENDREEFYLISVIGC